MSKPVAAHHAVNLLEEDTAVNDTRLSESWCWPKLFFNMSSTNSPLSLSSVNCEVHNKQRAATIVEGGPKVLDVNPVVGLRRAERVQDVCVQEDEGAGEVDRFVICTARRMHVVHVRVRHAGRWLLVLVRLLASATAHSCFTVETKARMHGGKFRCWNSLV